jgi:hypothetical protein
MARLPDRIEPAQLLLGRRYMEDGLAPRAAAVTSAITVSTDRRTNRRHNHWRAVAPPPTRSTRNSLARTVTGAQQHTVNHTANLPDPRGIAGGGTAITTGRERHTSSRAPD